VTLRWWPRSIRLQMLASLLLLESLSIVLFGWFVTRQQSHEVYDRTRRRTAFQAESLALEAREALLDNRPSWVALFVTMVEHAPTVATARITDPAGKILYAGPSGQRPLSPLELQQIGRVPRDISRCFAAAGGGTECVHAIFTGNDLRGLAWIQSDPAWDYEELSAVQRDTAIFGFIWIAASALLVLFMARSIVQPLAALHGAARALTDSPDDSNAFPLPVAIPNEIGDLIETFNRMVSSLGEQRAGLNETLSLLDSMLAHAPIGLAFLDRDSRLVRVNQVFAEMSGVPLGRHLGRSLPEILPQTVGQELEDAVLRVFVHGEPVSNLEFSGQRANAIAGPHKWMWLASVYPVRTTPDQVRWVGIIAIDASERRRSEEALRNSEKLAVTGRLAASIAHEINNPLEAITNLLFLLRHYSPGIEGPALSYLEMLEYEVRRISEITQQTLRFYRQSTLPARAAMSEILDPVLRLYQSRVNSLDLHVERRYSPDLDLFCFAGEIRQVIANLVGNAIDACARQGGLLLLRARRSRAWKNPQREGVRFVVADTGEGMAPAVRERIFEPFFTTKEATGTGLGLWVSQQIIQKHHGVVHVRSRAAAAGHDSGRSSGTVFQFFIPDDPGLLAEVRGEPGASHPA
jgi:PAS domain S-box-containing protein